MAQPYADVASVLPGGLDQLQRSALLEFEAFLRSEAVVAGGIGPHEADRIRDRHVADSLMYALGLPSDTRTIVDVGSGVGLPAIPLAIALPDAKVTLVDRSQRRTDLAGRACRILRLSNVTIVNAEADPGLVGEHDAVTFRASLPIEAATTLVAATVNPRIIGLLGVSRGTAQPSVPAAPDGIVYQLDEVATGVLDSPFWLLRMTFA